MSGLLTTLLSSVNALRVFDRTLGVIQNNVTNVATPGYARQRLSPVSLPFDPEAGLPGGIAAGELESSRSEYAEQSVRRAQQYWGRFRQMGTDLTRVEPMFDVTGVSGIPGALSKLFQGFSAWSIAPNDTVARRIVIDRAGEAAREFGSTATALTNVMVSLDQPIRLVTERINTLGGVICGLNDQLRRDFHSRSDPSIDASLQSTLEELAEYVDFTVLKQEDGSVTVLLGGEVPLAVGSRQYTIEADFSGGAVAIRDAEGRDVSSRVSGGRLSGLLETRNSTIPSYLADLDRLASSLADQVNGILAAGLDASGNPGAPLFAYDPAAAATTLQVTAITPPELAAALPGAPGGNGNALVLAGLANAPAIDGRSLPEFYAELAARVGQTLQAARQREQTHEDMLVQARAWRSEESGVSLDEEAAGLIQFQRAYQASARVVTALDELVETTINLLR